jgi:citrate lyase subunit beta-like protein
VQINYQNDELLHAEAVEGSQMGFEGKQVIHPRQVGVVQEVFSPSEGSIAAARDLMAAFREHQARGAGSFVFKGQMIDNPTMLQARNVLARAGLPTQIT